MVVDKYDVSAENLSLESSYIKAPLEQFRKVFRAEEKLVDKELPASKTKAALETVKRKLEDLHSKEDAIFDVLLRRIDDLSCPSSDYERKKLFRLIADYMLRKGYVQTAAALCAHFGIAHQIDFELFRVAQEIEAALSMRSVVEALHWCHDNRLQLKKINSKFEFLLRVQQFVELLRLMRYDDAIEFSHKHFAPFWDAHQSQIQTVMTLLAVKSSTQIAAYKHYFEDSRWNDLIAMFHSDLNDVYALTDSSPLVMHLEAGLSALKTHMCYDNDAPITDCPVCSDDFKAFAQSLPFSHHETSQIVCRLTGQIINEDNPPMVLPNGQVYGLHGISAAIEAKGSFTCPVTGKSFALEDLKKCFIA